MRGLIILVLSLCILNTLESFADEVTQRLSQAEFDYQQADREYQLAKADLEQLVAVYKKVVLNRKQAWEAYNATVILTIDGFKGDAEMKQLLDISEQGFDFLGGLVDFFKADLQKARLKRAKAEESKRKTLIIYPSVNEKILN